MLVQASANAILDRLLEKLCLELDLSEKQHERATRAYETFGNWLSADNADLSDYQPRVFPQGSVLLRVATRPRRGDGFEADGVCLLVHNGRGGRS